LSQRPKAEFGGQTGLVFDDEYLHRHTIHIEKGNSIQSGAHLRFQQVFQDLCISFVMLMVDCFSATGAFR
jgi:hypothetical protein